MRKMQNHFIALLLLGIVLIAGCTNTQIDAFLKAYPAAKAFTDQYPNAKINTVLVDQKTTVAQLIDISKESGVIPFSDYYKSVIDDVESNTKLTVWMDAKTYKIPGSHNNCSSNNFNCYNNRSHNNNCNNFFRSHNNFYYFINNFNCRHWINDSNNKTFNNYNNPRGKWQR